MRSRWVATGASIALVLGSVAGPARAASPAPPSPPRPAGIVEIGSVEPWYPVGRSVGTRLPDGRVVFIDGQTARLWDPTDGSWSGAGTLGSARAFGFSSTLLPDGRVVVAGGFARRPKPEGGRWFPRDIEVWDPATRAFSVLGRLPQGRIWTDGFALTDGRLLLVGGSADTRHFRDTLIWDPVDGGVTKGVRLSSGMVATGDPMRGLGLQDGRLILAGGSARRPGPRILVARVDPVGDAEIMHRMPGHGPVIPYALPDGRVLLVGQGREIACSLMIGSTCEARASIAVLDPANGEAAGVASIRGQLGSTQTPDGSVVVVGPAQGPCHGDAACVRSTDVSRWNAVTGALEVIGRIPVPMAAPTLATLADGSVLVVGDDQLWRVDPGVGSVEDAGGLPVTGRPWNELVPLLDGRTLIVNEEGTVLLWTAAAK